MECQDDLFKREMINLGCYVDPSKRFVKLTAGGELRIGGVFVLGEIEKIVQAMRATLGDA